MQAMAYGKTLQRHRRDRVFGPLRMLFALASMPTTPFVALLLIVICLMVLVMVGMLCVRHWMLAAQGNTYVGKLKGEKVAEGGAPGAPALSCTRRRHGRSRPTCMQGCWQTFSTCLGRRTRGTGSCRPSKKRTRMPRITRGRERWRWRGGRRGFREGGSGWRM